MQQFPHNLKDTNYINQYNMFPVNIFAVIIISFVKYNYYHC